jgi:hypothetical protein
MPAEYLDFVGGLSELHAEDLRSVRLALRECSRGRRQRGLGSSLFCAAGWGPRTKRDSICVCRGGERHDASPERRRTGSEKPRRPRREIGEVNVLVRQASSFRREFREWQRAYEAAPLFCADQVTASGAGRFTCDAPATPTRRSPLGRDACAHVHGARQLIHPSLGPWILRGERRTGYARRYRLQPSKASSSVAARGAAGSVRRSARQVLSVESDASHGDTGAKRDEVSAEPEPRTKPSTQARTRRPPMQVGAGTAHHSLMRRLVSPEGQDPAIRTSAVTQAGSGRRFTRGFRSRLARLTMTQKRRRFATHRNVQAPALLTSMKPRFRATVSIDQGRPRVWSILWVRPGVVQSRKLFSR